MAMGRSRGVIMNRDKKIREVERHGKHVQGKNEYLKFLRSEQITRGETDATVESPKVDGVMSTSI